MKKKRNRTPAHKVNRRQKALAIRALADIVSSPDESVQPYVRAKAAASLLGADKTASADEPAVLDPDGPSVVIFLPHNGVEVRGFPTVFGPREDSPGVVIVDGRTAEGRADYLRWKAEAEAAGHRTISPQ